MKENSFIFRREVFESDLAAVREMVESTGFFYADEADIAVELVAERLSKGDASDYYFIFVSDGGAPIGYVCHGPVAATRGSFDLYWLVIHKDHQRRGLGSILMREAEKDIRAMGGKRIYVDTAGRDLYKPTRAFYESIGYKAEAVLKDFYDIGDSKYIFSLELL